MELKQQYLEGLKYNYKGENIVIQRVKRVNGNIVIITNKRTFNFTEVQADEFEASLEKYKEDKPITLNSENFNINDILIESINKVRTDKNYIPQANAICNVISQMINIKKLEILIKKR